MSGRPLHVAARPTDADAPIRVGQSFPTWLPLTQTWLHAQVANLPAVVESHVLCERVENLDLFGVPHIHSLDDATRARRTYDRALRKLGLRRDVGYLRAAARRAGVRLVHSHFGNVGWTDVPLVRSVGARHVTTFYGMDVNKLPRQEPVWRDRYAELFASVDRVLCEGPHMARCVVELGCPAHKAHVQRLGVDVAGIRYVPRRWMPGAPLRVLIVASFREKKGIPDALEAVARLRRERPVEVTVIGDAGPEPASRQEKARILEVVAERELGDAVRFMGYQPPAVIFEEAYGHHVFLSPSRTAADGDTEGGAPVTLTEMVATGIPVVSTTHCDIPSVVEHGHTGYLAAEGDVEALADHLRRLASEPDSWSSLTRAGRAKVEREFDAVVQGRALARHYEEVLTR